MKVIKEVILTEDELYQALALYVNTKTHGTDAKKWVSLTVGNFTLLNGDSQEKPCFTGVKFNV